MKSYRLQKVDTNLYVQGLSGALVFKALYGVLAAFLLFIVLYIGIGTFAAVLICIPTVFVWLHYLHRIQEKLGATGWNKKQTAKKLPEFIAMKTRFHLTQA